ncbi:MAG: uncharacterized protein JWM12_979 [Ilumatobacteraceae bacterium]|nr:uncharacterized protein [Ilumatobacteraceae bacterium]
MDESQLFRMRADGIATQDLGDEVVVLDLRSSSYLLLNATGAALWPALATAATIAELAVVLTERFDVDEERATKGAAGFVQELLGLGLIELAERE